VTVTFNEKVDVATAELPGNYSISPLAPTTKAKAAADGLSVTVSADFLPDTYYLVKVEDVLSATGHPLIDDKSTAAFRTPPPVG
jgi:hypothetical protein